MFQRRTSQTLLEVLYFMDTKQVYIPGFTSWPSFVFSLTCSVNFLKADHEPSRSNGKSSFFPKIFGKNLLKKNALKGV